MSIRHIVVAVPARNEVETIGSCLHAVDLAASAVPVTVSIVVAADSCTDATADRARACPLVNTRLTVLTGAWGRVGGARAAAVAHGLSLSPFPPHATWIANTDADCVVDRAWLAGQLMLSPHHRAVAGIVRLDHSAPYPLARAFELSYDLEGPTHRHVHGANLGVRADTYLGVGGWNAATMVGEDNELWRSLGAGGRRVVHSHEVTVTTSARTASRVEGGFATRLAELADDHPAAVAPVGAHARP